MNVLRYSYESKLASAAVVAMLALSGIFAAFLIIPRVTAASGPTLTASSTSVKYNSFVTLTGTGFAPNAEITVKVGGQTAGLGTFVFAGVNSLFDQVTQSPVTDADGYFQTVIQIKDNPAGKLTISASDGTSSKSVTVTMNPSLKLSTKSGFPQETFDLTFSLHGFAANDVVSITSTALGISGTCNADANGKCSTTIPGFVVPDTKMGAKTITATGASGNTTSATFTVNAYIAFYTTSTGTTPTASVIATQPTAVYVEGHGFPKGTIPANNMTFTGSSGTVTSTMSSVTVGNDGTFGVTTHVAVLPNSNLPFGPLTVKYDGMTFSYQNGNIFGPIPGGLGWGSVLIGSVVGSSSSSAVLVLDSQSYMPDVLGGTTVAVFGYGFASSTPVTITPPSVLSCSNPTPTSSSQGAVFTTCTLGEAAYGTYTVTASGGGVGNVIQASFSITPWIDLSNGANDPTVTVTLDAKTSLFDAIGGEVIVHGFNAGKTVALSVKGSNLASPMTLLTISVGADGSGASTTAATAFLDVAGGTYDLVAKDNAPTPASSTFAGAVTVVPVVASTAHNALTVDSGVAGTQTVLRSGSDGNGQPFGVHGLAPNTKYTVTFGIAPGSPVIGTFTTNSAGQIPGAGIVLTIPAGASGYHLLGIWQNGSDALFGSVLMDEPNHLTPWVGQYGDLIFQLSANVQLLPTAGGVGTVVTVSGNALTPGTTYYVWLLGQGVYRATFTSTSTGSVPAGVNFTFPAEPTIGNENATVYTVCVGTSTDFPNTCDNSATFILHATASLSTTTAAPGQAVTVSALGLQAGQLYAVVFNKQVVATFSANAVGTGSTTFTVPSGTAPGTYQVKIYNPATPAWALLSPPTLTVTSGAAISTQSLTPGTPTQTTLNGQPTVAVSYTNTLSVSVTAVVYAVVMNSAGQVVYYTTATITASAGSSQTAYAVLAGLPHGTYTVTLFAIVNNQVASTTTTTQVTI